MATADSKLVSWQTWVIAETGEQKRDVWKEKTITKKMVDFNNFEEAILNLKKYIFTDLIISNKIILKLIVFYRQKIQVEDVLCLTLLP